MSEIIIPSNPEDLKKIRQAIKELAGSMHRVQSEKDYQKDTIDEIGHNFNLDKKFIKKIAQDYFKDSFEKRSEEFEQYSSLYEVVMLLNIVANGNDND